MADPLPSPAATDGGDRGAFACLRCPGAPEFPSLGELVTHLEAVHTPAPFVTCPVCGVQTTNLALHAGLCGRLMAPGGEWRDTGPAADRAPGGQPDAFPADPGALAPEPEHDSPEGLVRNALQLLAGVWSPAGELVRPFTAADADGIRALISRAQHHTAARGADGFLWELGQALEQLGAVCYLAETLHMIRFRLNEAVRTAPPETGP